MRTLYVQITAVYHLWISLLKRCLYLCLSFPPYLSAVCSYLWCFNSTSLFSNSYSFYLSSRINISMLTNKIIKLRDDLSSFNIPCVAYFFHNWRQILIENYFSEPLFPELHWSVLVATSYPRTLTICRNAFTKNRTKHRWIFSLVI